MYSQKFQLDVVIWEGDNMNPYMNVSISAKHKHEPTMKARRVNGKITEVKQPQDQSNSKMGDHLGSIHFVFFQCQKC